MNFRARRREMRALAWLPPVGRAQAPGTEARPPNPNPKGRNTPMSTPDSDDRAFAAELFSRPDNDTADPDEATEPGSRRRVRLAPTNNEQTEDTGNPVLDPDSAGAIARRLFSHSQPN